jgi:hypothetical protein
MPSDFTPTDLADAHALLARCEPSAKSCTLSRLLSEAWSELPTEALFAAVLASGIKVEPGASGNPPDARVYLSAPWGWTRPTPHLAVATLRTIGTPTVREDALRREMKTACLSPTGRKPPGALVAQAVRDAVAGGLIEQVGSRRYKEAAATQP